MREASEAKVADPQPAVFPMLIFTIAINVSFAIVVLITEPQDIVWLYISMPTARSVIRGPRKIFEGDCSSSKIGVVDAPKTTCKT
jgi:hypothetical protein